MAVGYPGRVHLPVPVLLRLEVKSQDEVGRGTRTSGRRLASLVLLQRPQCPLFPHPEKQNQRVHYSDAGGQVSRRDQ